jgi:ribosomal silencing factor RsfS
VKEEVTKAVGECCEALEKCCEAVEECKLKGLEVTDLKLEPVLADPDLVVIDDVTTAKQNEKAAQKAAKKAKKAEKKKAKERQHQENGGGV